MFIKHYIKVLRSSVGPEKQLKFGQLSMDWSGRCKILITYS